MIDVALSSARAIAAAVVRIDALEKAVAKLTRRLAALESRSSLALPPVNEP